VCIDPDRGRAGRTGHREPEPEYEPGTYQDKEVTILCDYSACTPPQWH
jgi:hypothetical protein